MAYTEYTLSRTENARILLITDIHNCHVRFHGMENENRMKLLCESLETFYQCLPYDGIFCLGDYSLDFWAWKEGGSFLWNPPISRTKEFMKNYCSRFPTKTFLIPGNHEQYSDDQWQEIIGTPREFAVVYGNYVFAMCDTFAGNLNPTDNNDGTYTGLNTAFIKEVLVRHPDKQIFLCAHDLILHSESKEAKELICDSPNILCAFTGHTHRSCTVISNTETRCLPIIYCGNFSSGSAVGCTEEHLGFCVLNLNKSVVIEYVTLKDMGIK